tara:strand:- start:42 stop:314 length:273 start_codon:yes stop_codon:yes gene_type:complete
MKRYSLYTFTKSKLIWTETENLQQALKNFNRRLNIDHNGYNHPEMEYVFNPMRVITRDVVGDDSKSNETILSFNCKKLDERILKEVEQWT